MIVPSMLSKRGDDAMRTNQVAMRIGRFGLTLFVISLGLGLGMTALTANPAPLFAMTLVGLYFLFAIRVADQWERVAVLRFGKYIGLKGPGLFHLIPVVDTISRYVDQRVRV